MNMVALVIYSNKLKRTNVMKIKTKFIKGVINERIS